MNDSLWPWPVSPNVIFPMNDEYFGIDERTKVSEIEQHARMEGLVEASFSGAVSIDVLDALEQHFLSRRTDIEVRFYGFYQSICDLSVLKHIPSVTHLKINCLRGEVVGVEAISQLKRLSTLGIGIEQLSSLDFLSSISSPLESLVLEKPKRRGISVEPLRGLSSLKKLYLEGYAKDINALGGIANLEELTLCSISIESLDTLVPLESLRKFTLALGGTTNLDALVNIPSVRDLTLSRIRALENLDVLKDLYQLETLELDGLPNVKDLPPLNALTSLRELYIHGLSGLFDLSEIAEAPSLETLKVTGMSHCSPEIFSALLKHPKLREVAIGLGNFKKNRAVRDLFSGTKVSVGPEMAFGRER